MENKMFEKETYDLIMSIASIFFVLGVIFQNVKLYKTKDASSISYGLAFFNSFALTVVVFCMFGLELWLSAWVLLLQTFLWYLILFFKIRYSKK